MATQLPPDVVLEEVYVVEGMYGPDAAELRRPVRARHLERLARLRDEGVLIEGGGFADLSGSLLIVRADSEAAAMAIAQDDPYLTAGVWVEVRVRAFGRVARPAELA